METVNHPHHYQGASDLARPVLTLLLSVSADLDRECIEIIEEWGLDFHVGNAVKYLWLCGQKADAIEDLQKARWYLDRTIKKQFRKDRGVCLAAIAMIDELIEKIPQARAKLEGLL